jgi:hypothetical protein
MSKIGKPTRVKAKRLVIGLRGFEKISAVEGLRLTRDMKGTFRNLDKRNASATERRSVISKKYGSSS